MLLVFKMPWSDPLLISATFSHGAIRLLLHVPHLPEMN
jgi:hypothetical protein